MGAKLKAVFIKFESQSMVFLTLEKLPENLLLYTLNNNKTGTELSDINQSRPGVRYIEFDDLTYIQNRIFEVASLVYYAGAGASNTTRLTHLRDNFFGWECAASETIYTTNIKYF